MYPVLYQFGPFMLRTDGIIFLIAAVLALRLALSLMKKKKLNVEFIGTYFLWFVIIGLAGGRFGYVAQNYNEFSANFLQVFALWDGGISFFWGLLFFALALWYFCQSLEESFGEWMDVLSLTGIFFFAFTSIGDFFSGAHFGSPPTLTFLPGITFHSQEIPYTIPLHPVQLYTAALLFIAFFFLNRLVRYKRRPGVFALMCMMAYFGIEFFMEFMRGTPTNTLLGYRLPQIADFVVLVAAFVLYMIKTHRSRIPAQSKSESTENHKDEETSSL